MKSSTSAAERVGGLITAQNHVFKYLALAAGLYLSTVLVTSSFSHHNSSKSPHVPPPHADEILAMCQQLHQTPGPPEDFLSRKESDRYVPETLPIFIKNATIWVGRGQETLAGTDIILDKGLIKRIGVNLDTRAYEKIAKVDARGAWVTPGIFDMHSHLGVDSVPELEGAGDTNSFKGVAQPWLRSLDGLNTHDEALKLSVAGGVTASLVLPGSANAIGGQAFPIKLRPTAERSPSSMVLEPPHSLNGSDFKYTGPPRWRHMKHACGENPSRVYGFTRMDTQWAFRQAYNEAQKIKERQDAYCAEAKKGHWHGLGEFPENLQWEALVDVLRGRVKVNNHCYEAVDFDGMIRLTNEFKFSIAAFHHAHEAFLVPDLLKKMYGAPPAVALFATNARYKREAYRGSEFAPRILADHGIQVVMKSDHPVLDSRYLLYEAQQAHFYGLPADLALASVTTTSAEVAGFGHRLGYVRVGYDADIVVWDSHPLALGATPLQVFIDGIPQLENPHGLVKPELYQSYPKVPNFDKEAKEAVKYDGLPPLKPANSSKDAIFINVKSLSVCHHNSGEAVSRKIADGAQGIVVVRDGKVACAGSDAQCGVMRAEMAGVPIVDLEGGSIAPGLLSYGAPLGLEEISEEASTGDGVAPAPLVDSVPSLVGGDKYLPQAIDGLTFETRDALIAYRAGVTSAISAPKHRMFLGGLSAAFSLGSPNRLTTGAIIKPVAALHVSIVDYVKKPSISTQIAALRFLLLGKGEGDVDAYFNKAAKGEIPLVIDTENADVIATLLSLKEEVEGIVDGGFIRLVIAGGAEAHLLAKELGEAHVGVIFTRPRAFPATWGGRRIETGIPLSKDTAFTTLLKHNVTVGFGIQEAWEGRNQRFELAWAAINAGGLITDEEAIAIGTTNLEKLLGLEVKTQGDLVAYRGGDIFEMTSKVVAVISESRAHVDLFLP